MTSRRSKKASLTAFAQVPDSRLCALTGPSGALCAVVIDDGGGDTFDCYADEGPPLTTTLSFGTGFDGPWVIQQSRLGLQGEDTFESYNVGTDVTGLNGGYGFDGAWVVSPNYRGWGPGSSGEDTFETYSSAVAMNDGTGWTGPWVTKADSGTPEDPADDFEPYTEGRYTSDLVRENYTAFQNWDVVAGAVDLLGHGYLDYFPLWGFYVDMAGSPGLGKLVSKVNGVIAPAANRTNHLIVNWAGNQRVAGDSVIRVTYGTLVEDITIPWNASPTATTFDVTALAPLSALVSVELISTPDATNNAGPLLMSVRLESRTLDPYTGVVTFQTEWNGTFQLEDPGLLTFGAGGFGWTGYWQLNPAT